MPNTPWYCVVVDDFIVVEGNLKCIGAGGRGRAGGRHILVHDNDSEIQAFRKSVAARYVEAKAAGRADAVPDGPIETCYEVRLQRPAAAKKRLWPWKRGSGSSGGDLDKLIRAANDALSGWAFRDDSQICRFGKTEKRYATPDERVGITVWWRAIVDEETPLAS